jgi:uncharacterized MAPEG superfamily protein
MTYTTALLCFGLISLILIATEIMFTYATLGFGYGFSSNRPTVTKSPLGLRIERSYRNQVESASYILPALVAGALLGGQTPAQATAALLIVVGRASFALLYYTGVPFIRVPAFVLASFPSLFLFVTLLMQHI